MGVDQTADKLVPDQNILHDRPLQIPKALWGTNTVRVRKLTLRAQEIIIGEGVNCHPAYIAPVNDRYMKCCGGRIPA
jgi:hypothetical protein